MVDSKDVKNMCDLSLDVSMNLIRYKIVFVGDVAVGKTSIIGRLMDNKFKNEYDPSIGVDFFSKTIKYRGKCVKLQVWDSAGQEKYRSLIPNYIRGSSVVFLVFDLANKESFISLQSWIEFINNYEHPNIVLCGNKLDLEDERQVTQDEAKNVAQRENMMYFEISAKTGDGLKKMIFTSIAELPFFDQYRLASHDIISELEMENSEPTARSNLSILDSSRAQIQFSRNQIIQRKQLQQQCKC